MSTYRTPLSDIRFTLQELADLDLVCQIPDAEAVADPELRDAILDQAARFAEQVLAPLNRSGDVEGAHWQDGAVRMPAGFREAQAEFVQAGWNHIALPAEHGGQGLPIVLCTAVQEMFTSANKAFCYGSELTEFAVKAIAAAGSEWQKAQWLPPLVSGRWMATMNLTEPQAGSDVGALRTRAQPQADGSHRVFGQKIFISYGEHDLAENILHLVLARLPGAPEGSAGVSLFAVPKILPDGTRNDLRCTGIEHKLGNHASPTCTMVYGAGGEGAVGWLVGNEHQGLRAMFVMVNSARLTVGQEGTAMSERAYQQALAYARERVQGRPAGADGPVPIIQHPDVRRLLLSMRSQTEAMRAVGYLLGAARDLAARHPDASVRRSREAFLNLMIPVFKGWATETAIELTSMSIQVHGGIGYVEESGVSQPLRDVRVAAIYEGTTAIQAQDLVERKLVRDGGAALRAWLALVQGTLQALKGESEPALCDIHSALADASGALRGAAEHALARYAEHPREVLGGSVPLLRLMGTVLGGWQLARGALAARRRLDEGRGDERFLRARIDSARFYAAHVLPQARALAEVSMHGGEAVLAMAEDAF
jgi:alkylation response protein AidB-like acyl-CoA dehydrogenase